VAAVVETEQARRQVRLHVAMTDAPSCGFDHVYVTVDKVRVNASSTAGDTDSGWTDIALPAPQKVDLLSLTNGVLTDLGRAPLAAGQYQQLRLVLAQNQGNTLANSVVVSGTTTACLGCSDWRHGVVYRWQRLLWRCSGGNSGRLGGVGLQVVID
jgi:hypothetical protein